MDSTHQLFISKVFIEHLLCASSFIAYGSESNGPGLQHRGAVVAITILTSALPPPPPHPSNDYPLKGAPSCSHFADGIIKRWVGAGAYPAPPLFHLNAVLGAVQW